MRVVPRGTISAQTPALRGRVRMLRVGRVVVAVVAPDCRALARCSALGRGHHVWAHEGRVGQEARLISGLPRRQGSCTCTWGSSSLRMRGPRCCGGLRCSSWRQRWGGRLPCGGAPWLWIWPLWGGRAEGTANARESLLPAVRRPHVYVEVDDGTHGKVALRERLCGAQHRLHLHGDRTQGP